MYFFREESSKTNACWIMFESKRCKKYQIISATLNARIFERFLTIFQFFCSAFGNKLLLKKSQKLVKILNLLHICIHSEPGSLSYIANIFCTFLIKNDPLCNVHFFLNIYFKWNNITRCNGNWMMLRVGVAFYSGLKMEM